MNTRVLGVGEYRFAFNGKEAETNFTEGVYDFGARLYDSRIGRWMAVAPRYRTNL